MPDIADHQARSLPDRLPSDRSFGGSQLYEVVKVRIMPNHRVASGPGRVDVEAQLANGLVRHFAFEDAFINSRLKVTVIGLPLPRPGHDVRHEVRSWKKTVDERNRRAGKPTKTSSSSAIRAEFKTFFENYVEAALWLAIDEAGSTIDARGRENQITKDSLAKMKRDCYAFFTANLPLIRDNVSRAGSDFLLTRNGHGAGFWDGDWPKAAGDALTKASKPFGEQILERSRGRFHVLG